MTSLRQFVSGNNFYPFRTWGKKISDFRWKFLRDLSKQHLKSAEETFVGKNSYEDWFFYHLRSFCKKNADFWQKHHSRAVKIGVRVYRGTFWWSFCENIKFIFIILGLYWHKYINTWQKNDKFVKIQSGCPGEYFE